MSVSQYWYALFGKGQIEWQEFLDKGANILGFPTNRWPVVQQIEPGDYILCYHNRPYSCWLGILEVTSEPFYDDELIWQAVEFKSRIHVKVIIRLPLKEGIPMKQILTRLTIYGGKANSWKMRLIDQPQRWSSEDGEVILNVLQESENQLKLYPVTD